MRQTERVKAGIFCGTVIIYNMNVEKSFSQLSLAGIFTRANVAGEGLKLIFLLTV